MILIIGLLALKVFCAGSANPNFILILTDDQDVLLNGMIPMQQTVRMISNKGMTFENAFVNSPICCPSRGTILTGKYAHNTGLVNNSLEGNCSSTSWQKNQEPFSIAAILKGSRNYTTFYAGKYLNKYGYEQAGGTEHVPQGYDWWIGLKGNSRYYKYTLSVNGSALYYKDKYLTDVLANYSMDFLKDKPHDKPFFMTLAPPAAHAPFTPAKRHQHAFPMAKAIRNPSFNYTSSDKHWIVQMPPKHLPDNVTILDDIQKHRMQTLLAVDAMVKRIVEKLKELKLIKNTYIIFTSDNGYHIGQFTQPWDKRQPYETDIRVPLTIRGPRIPRKSLSNYPVASVDLAPTILDLAGVQIPTTMDGQSFKSHLFTSMNSAFKKHIFVEYWGEGSKTTVDPSCPWTYETNLQECSSDQWCKCQDSKNNTYACVLEMTDVNRFKFCEFEDNENFMEAYNLMTDPYELINIYSKMQDDAISHYSTILRKFRTCESITCKL